MTLAGARTLTLPSPARGRGFYVGFRRDLADVFEAAADAGVGGESGTYFVVGEAQRAGDDQRAEGVLHVVAPGETDRVAAEKVVFVGDVEVLQAAFVFDQRGAVVGRGVQRVGDQHGALGQGFLQGHGFVVVGAEESVPPGLTLLTKPRKASFTASKVP